MTQTSPSLVTDLQQLAQESDTVVEFDARVRDVVEARLGADMARRVVSGASPAAAGDGRPERVVDAAAMVSVCRELLGVRQEQLASERQTASTDELHRVLLESAGGGIYGVDREGRCTFINGEGLRLLGFDDDTEVLGRNMHDLVHHTRADGSAYPIAECAIFDAHREGRRVVCDDEVLFRRDGSSFPAEYRSNPVVCDGQVEGSVMTFADMTELRQTAMELEQSRSLQRMAGEVARLGGWSLDVARQEVTWSDELYEIFDLPRDVQPEVLDSLGRYLLPGRDQIEQALKDCAATGTPFDLEAQLKTYGDRRVWVRAIGGPRYGPDGTVTHIRGAVQDIDQLKASTQRAEELSARLIGTLESMTDAFWTVDSNWRINYINRRAEQLLQRSRDELLGVDLWESFPEAVGSVLDEVYHRVMSTGVSEVISEFHWHPLDLWLDIHVYVSDQGLAVYFRDVGDQRTARLELREREARVAWQAALLDKARDAIVVRDLDHRITFWNHGAERLYGYSADEARGHSVRELICHDHDQFDTAQAELLEHGEWAGELRHVAKDASELITEARWTLMRDGDGQPTSVLSIKSDVTERRRLEQQLLRAQRLESLGTLSGGIAHDLNNELAPILLLAQSMQLEQPDQPLAHTLSIIEQSATRAADMVRRMMAFAGGFDSKQEEVDVNEIVDQTTAIVRKTFPRNIELHREGPGQLPPVLGDVTQLHQVLMNLCINARDAMPDGGHLRIGLDVATATDDAIAHGCPPGRYVMVRVEDTGTGMDLPTLERAFEPYYTTKPQGQGTGLGLSTAHGIVRNHGGFIQLSSEPGEGSTFILHLPLASGTEEPPVWTGAAELVHGGGQLLLLIEDEDNVRTATRSTLEAHGYRVLDAANGRDALPLFDEHAEEIAAVITDMRMPHMDGPTTIEHLLDRTPTTPILAISGMTTGPEATRSAELGVTHMLAKPYSRNDLITKVAQLLDLPRQADT